MLKLPNKFLNIVVIEFLFGLLEVSCIREVLLPAAKFDAIIGIMSFN